MWDEIDSEEVEDNEGWTRLVEVGSKHPPRHADGSRVVTPRLQEKITAGEMLVYNGGLPGKIMRYAWSRTDATGTPSVDADDLAQEALIYVVANPLELSEDHLEAYVIRLVRNLSIDIRRKEKGPEFDADAHRHYKKLDVWADAADQLELKAAPEFVPQVLPGEWAAWIRASLPDKTAEAVILVFEDGFTHREAAKATGVTSKTVQRAILTLKEASS